MPVISGINVNPINVKINGGIPVISVNFKPAFPVLIDVTATLASGHQLGRAIINDANPNNNFVVLNGFNHFLNQVVWLRIVVFHPSLNQFDFNVFVSQDGKGLASFHVAGTFSGSTYKYEGFILNGVQ
ncbi:MAG: hypothetical protein B0W54_19265 [Cellvibrio sp. 79]|nr:MAG: hypothetical protein B0W54_19265 [Cellvibrio sp. 79]